MSRIADGEGGTFIIEGNTGARQLNTRFPNTNIMKAQKSPGNYKEHIRKIVFHMFQTCIFVYFCDRFCRVSTQPLFF